MSILKTRILSLALLLSIASPAALAAVPVPVPKSESAIRSVTVQMNELAAEVARLAKSAPGKVAADSEGYFWLLAQKVEALSARTELLRKAEKLYPEAYRAARSKVGGSARTSRMIRAVEGLSLEDWYQSSNLLASFDKAVKLEGLRYYVKTVVPKLQGAAGAIFLTGALDAVIQFNAGPSGAELGKVTNSFTRGYHMDANGNLVAPEAGAPAKPAK